MDDSLSIGTQDSVPIASDFGLAAKLVVPAHVHVGDTVELTVHVTWSEAPHAWLLLPQNSPESSKLLQVNQSMEQSQSIQGGVMKPEIQVKYRMLAKDTGEVMIPALQFELPTPSGATIELKSEPASMHIGQPIAWGLYLGMAAAFVLVLFGIWTLLKKKRAGADRKVKESARQKALRERLEMLASRVMVADARAWMLELESVVNDARAALDLQSDDQKTALRKLDDAFGQARYGGGPRDAWENKEWLRLARTALNIQKDQEDNYG